MDSCVAHANFGSLHTTALYTHFEGKKCELKTRLQRDKHEFSFYT
jgi:hypothetical protein